MIDPEQQWRRERIAAALHRMTDADWAATLAILSDGGSTYDAADRAGMSWPDLRAVLEDGPALAASGDIPFDPPQVARWRESF